MRWNVLVIVTCYLVLWPLLRSGFYISDDGEWMIIRLSAFYQSLAEGQFPVRFLGRLNYSYGYPVANFLYPGFMYIGSIIHFLGFSFVNSVKIILGASVLGAALFIFWALRRSFSAISSYIGVFSFITAPYLAFDLYKRGSVGEVLALFAAAVAPWSLETGRRAVFPLAIALLIVSHNSLALMFFIFFGIYALNSRRLSYLPHLLLGVGISAFFWLPALFERNLVRFGLVTISLPEEHFVTVNNLELVGLLFIVGFVVYILSGRRHKYETSRIFLIGCIASLFLASPWSAAIWENRLFASLFQFPYRFLAVTIILVPWLIASVIEKTRAQKSVIFLFLALGVISLVPMLDNIEFVNRVEGYYTTNEATTTVADEYMPRWVGALPAERNSNRVEIFQGKGVIEPRIVNTQQIDVDLDLEEDSTIAINSIYYPGWGVVLDGQPVAIDYQNDRGLMRVDALKGTHRLIAEFRETPQRFVADSISIASLIVWMLLLIRKRKL